MVSKQKKALYDLLLSLVQERDILNLKYEDNLVDIQEIDSRLQSIHDKNDSDFKVFSPRKAENVYKEDIDKCTSDKNEILEANDIIASEIEKLSSRIEVLIEALDIDPSEISFDNSNFRDKNLSLLKVQEIERQRIARDLHDSSLQNLTHLIHKLELASLYIDSDTIKARLEIADISKILRNTMDDIRNTIYDLRPMTFDDLGFKASIERIIGIINANHQYNIDMEIDDLTSSNNLLLANIYRIVQELLFNIHKHSEAKNIMIHVKHIDNLCKIDISDDGKGFVIESSSSDNHHFGLNIVKERVELLGGNIEFDSLIYKGTKVKIIIPM